LLADAAAKVPLQVVGEADRGQAQSKWSTGSHRCLLLDVNHAGMNGIESRAI